VLCDVTNRCLRRGILAAACAGVLLTAAPQSWAAVPVIRGKERPPAAKKTPRPADEGEENAAPDKQPYRSLEGKARVTLFGIEGEGSRIVFLLDRSASMGGPGAKALRAAKAELIAALDALGRMHQFNIVVYNERPAVFNPTGDPGRILFATDRNKEEAVKFIESITPYDGTRHDDAVKTAIKMAPDVIFWLTDADDPKLGPNQQERINAMAAGITINTIEFGTGPQTDAGNFLVKIARANGGKHAYVDVSKLPERKK
jgi:hypothetical protein